MKAITTLRIIVLMGVFSLYSCKEWDKNVNEIPPQSTTGLSVEEAKKWFDSESNKVNSNARVQKTPYNYDKEMLWLEAGKIKLDDGQEVVIVSIASTNAPTPVLRKNKKSKELEDKHREFKANVLSNLLIFKDKAGKMQSEITLLIPDDDFYEKKNHKMKDYSGLLLVTDLQDEFIRGFRYKKGKLAGGISLGRANTKKNGRPSDQYICDYVDWFSCAYVQGGDVYCQYTHTDPVYCEDNLGGGGFSGTQYIYTSGGGGLGYNPDTGNYNLPNITFPGDDNNVVDIHLELNCFLSNPTNYQYKITVYVDQPIANSSTSAILSGAGHTFVGFSKTNPVTGQTIEKLVGFYPQAGKGPLSTIMNVPSAIHTNDASPYEVSVTYNVDATHFTNGINAAIGWENRDYSLEDFNCTNAAFVVCNAAGVSIPKPVSKTRLYTPSGITQDFFINSPAALGQALRSLPNNDPNRQVNAYNSSVTAYNSGTSCP